MSRMLHLASDSTDQSPEIPPLPIQEADPKVWWRSRAMVGALATILASLAGLAGLSVDPGLLADLLVQAVALGGGVLSLWGRLRAEQPISNQLLPPRS